MRNIRESNNPLALTNTGSLICLKKVYPNATAKPLQWLQQTLSHDYHYYNALQLYFTI